MEEKEFNVAEFIIDRFDSFILDQCKKTYPAYTNWASNLGHPCTRYLVHARLDWNKKDPISPSLQKRFEEGRRQEDAMYRLLDDLGIKVWERGVHFKWDKYQISGKLDSITEYMGTKYPTEIKSCETYVFDQINSIEDLRSHKRHYMRGYLTQLMVYMMEKNEEEGLFIFKGKGSGDIKPIILHFDYDLGEEFLKKAEIANKYVAKKEYPDRIPYNPEICDQCWFRTACLPPKENIEGVSLVDDLYFINLLEEREKLKGFHTEYDKIDREVKGILKAQKDKKLFAGDFMITGSDVHKDGYTVESNDYIRWAIKNLKKEE